MCLVLCGVVPDAVVVWGASQTQGDANVVSQSTASKRQRIARNGYGCMPTHIWAHTPAGPLGLLGPLYEDPPHDDDESKKKKRKPQRLVFPDWASDGTMGSLQAPVRRRWGKPLVPTEHVVHCIAQVEPQL